jgi:hypothetical protein
MWRSLKGKIRLFGRGRIIGFIPIIPTPTALPEDVDVRINAQTHFLLANELHLHLKCDCKLVAGKVCVR